MGSDKTWLIRFDRERRSVVQGDAIVRVGKIFRGEPPGNSVVFHSFQDKPGVNGGASPFIISKWKLPTGCTWPSGNG